jgi:hypothetical protein
MKARSTNNVQLMQAALMQAYTNQLVLLQLASRDNMMKLSHNWSAKAELDKLEVQIVSQEKGSQMIVDQDINNHPTSSELPYQAPVYPHYQQVSQNPLGAPPQPPQTDPGYQTNRPSTIPPQENLLPFVPKQASNYPLTTQNANYIPPHHLGYPPSYNPSSQHAGYQHHSVYPPTAGYHPPAEQEKNYQAPNHSPYQHPNNNRGQGRGRNNNWKRNQDLTSNMMEISNFFVRAKQALSALQRRGRGRGLRRQNHGCNQAPNNNAAPPA